MSEPSTTPTRIAWEPLTFGGVAAFARASFSRLFVVELLVALICGASVVWLVATTYCPVVLSAITKLPEQASIENGTLKNLPSQLLAETNYVSIAVDFNQTGQFGQSAEIQVELHETNFRICSLFRSLVGCLDFDYPQTDPIPLGRSQLEPWWGAWQPMILTGIGVATVLLLLVSWAVLATLYVVPIKLIAYFADRDISWLGGWRLASAALMPGAIFMALSVLFYGWGMFDIIGLGFFFMIHLVIGWIYLLFAPFSAPRLAAVKSPQINPFVS